MNEHQAAAATAPTLVTTWQSVLSTPAANTNKQSFFEEVSAKAKPTLNQIINSELIQQTVNGTLDGSINKFYTAQLAFYLKGVAQSLAHIAARSDTPKEIAAFLGFASYVMTQQQVLFNFYEGEKPQQSPSCKAYVDFLVATATTADIAPAVAAVLPTCWVHNKLIEYINEHTVPNNSYKAWIKMFSSPNFDQITQEAIDMTNQFAKEAGPKVRKQMEENFLRSTDMELTLVESSFNKELQKNSSAQVSLQLVHS